MYKIVRNSSAIKGKDGFRYNERGWVVVDKNFVKVSTLHHYTFGAAKLELERLKQTLETHEA